MASQWGEWAGGIPEAGSQGKWQRLDRNANHQHQDTPGWIVQETSRSMIMTKQVGYKIATKSSAPCMVAGRWWPQRLLPNRRSYRTRDARSKMPRPRWRRRAVVDTWLLHLFHVSVGERLRKTLQTPHIDRSAGLQTRESWVDRSSLSSQRWFLERFSEGSNQSLEEWKEEIEKSKHWRVDVPRKIMKIKIYIYIYRGSKNQNVGKSNIEI